MNTLMVMKPKVEPYVMIIGAFAVIVIIATLATAAMYSDLGVPILLVGFLFLLILALLIMQQLLRKRYTTYEISDCDVTWRFGMWAPDERVVPIDEITDINVDRSIFGIILGFGNLSLDTPSAEVGDEIIMRDIDSAELKKAEELLRGLIEQREVRRKGQLPKTK